MTIAPVYQPSPPAALANYDFTDLITRQGYADFYAVDLSGTKLLSRKAIASIYPAREYTGTGVVENISWTFTFQAPLIVDGILYMSRSYESKDLSSGFIVRSDIIIKKNSTVIAQSSGATIVFPNATAASHRDTVSVDVPATKFNPGDTITVQTPVFKSGSYTLLCHYDGAARGTTGVHSGYAGNQLHITTNNTLNYKNSTDLVVSVPFKVRQG